MVVINRASSDFNEQTAQGFYEESKTFLTEKQQ